MNKKQVRKINIRILLVDDDITFRKVIKSAFDLRDFEVVYVDAYTQATEALGQNPIHVMIINPFIQGVDGGFELIAEAKAKFPQVKIIAIIDSHRMTPEQSIKKAIESGADKVYQKPFNLLDLLKSVNQINC